MDDIILSIENISKQFPGVQALDDVSFSIKRGTIHALLGENGAGKSTLIKIISGVYEKDQGAIKMNGEIFEIDNPREALDKGIAVVHQELNLAEPLSVAENIFLGKLYEKGGFTDWKRVHREAAELLHSLGVDIDTSSIVRSLTVSQQQVVEICKAMTYDAKIYILDEPTAALTSHEIQNLFRIMKKIQDDGATILYISHRLEEVFEICDELTVLKDGQYIGTRNVADSSKDELIRMMIGRDLSEEFPKVEVPIGETVVEVDNFVWGKTKAEAKFYLRRGEILGFAGLIGSGRTELMRAMLGIDHAQGGEIKLYGNSVKYRKFSDAIKDGFGLIPEDRKRQGLVLGMPVKNNISLAAMQHVSKNGFISNKKESQVAQKYIDKLRINVPTDESQVRNLSGGNQQKVVISKWLLVNSEIIIVDEPTRGIDVGAKVEIFKILNSFVAEGKSVIMISSVLPELIGMCDRIYVMNEGQIKGMLNREDFSSEKILNIAFS